LAMDALAVEALACGIPVVASAVGGLRGVVRDGFNGRSVAPADPVAVAAALGDLVTAEARTQLAGSARASIAEFDVRATDAAMAALWAELGVAT
ncbi:MAG: glycosyltransferase, partial [Chloroflexi bacterium]|nr:glycosyltransferase [Chloroflexota bacterium]